ncbi:autoinducer 2 sensor kinase/phosphatase LuxQ [Abditibacteriota bacterium]|nr:autoinducer 2 sensor kinase/phosphatase LuxQ [Abditibacteriota bacterium]
MSNSKKPESNTGSHPLPSVPSSPPLRATGASETSTSTSEALMVSDERFHALFDAAPLAIGIVRNGLLLYANPALALLVGVPEPAQLVGKSARDFIEPAQHEHLTEHAHTRIKGGFISQTAPYETTVRRADGTRVPVRTEIAPISLPDGNAVISFAFDLSSERRAHNEIRALLEREQRSAHFARQLQELSQALSAASTPDEVASIGVERCVESVGAVGAIFVTPYENDGGETKLCLSQSRGYSAEAVAGWSKMSLSDPTPVAQAFQNDEAIWVGDVETPAQIARFPILAQSHLSGTYALVALPLRFDMRVLGVLGLTFDTTRDFDSEERVFMETLAASCAQALERARLDTEGRVLARRQRESLALLNTLLDSAPVGFGLFDRNHHYVLVNEELARINGTLVEDHIGKRPSEMPFATEIGRYVERLLEQVWETGAPSGEIEFAIGKPTDSDFRHCTLALYPIRVGGTGTQGGEMLGVGAILIEQTERVRLVNQLEIERARFEAILQQMPSGVIIAEAPSGRLILRNEQAAQIWGYIDDDSDISNVYPPEYRGRGFYSDGRELQSSDWPLSRALYAGEVVRDEEMVIERGNGEFGVIRANAAPIRDSDGTVSAGIVVFDNVTARARTDASQRVLAEAGTILVSALNEEDTFRTIARLCVPRIANWCAFVIPETRTTFTVAALAGPKESDSPEARALEAWLRRGVKLQKLISDAMANQRALLCSVRDLEEASLPHETEVFAGLGAREILIASVTARGRSLGAMIWINTSTKQPFDSVTLALGEGLGRRVGLSADNARLLQEAQQARDAAQRARDEAEAANRAKDEFLAVVSHELRTPLTPILGWLELLRSPDIDDELRLQAYDVIERNAIAQAQLVNDILDVSRITTGKLRLELKDVSLDEIVARSVESLRTIWDDKKLRVEQRIDPRISVRADGGRMGQVVWNLLQNAIKFTPPGGEIEVSLSRRVLAVGGPIVARLEVRDTGLGIEKEFLPHVFERFRQGDSSSTRKAGGLGLGLAIVSHIVELHGGQVGVLSQGYGRGATFWVEFPLVEEAQAPSPPPPSARVIEGRLKGAKVLVVDDEPDTREMLARLLEEAGATVRVAPGGRTALEITAQFSPSLIVSDIGMPDMSGLELRQELLARGFQTPAIALTAYASSKDEILTREAGFEGFLVKPVGTQELVEVAANLLHSS